MSTQNPESTDPREAEARKEPYTVVWRGHTFTIPSEYSEWSLELMEALEDNREVGIVRGALGVEQWRIVKSLDLKARDFNELVVAITKALGFDSAGELPASSA